MRLVAAALFVVPVIAQAPPPPAAPQAGGGAFTSQYGVSATIMDYARAQLRAIQASARAAAAGSPSPVVRAHWADTADRVLEVLEARR
jgi:hypothetical protein